MYLDCCVLHTLIDLSRSVVTYASVCMCVWGRDGGYWGAKVKQSDSGVRGSSLVL